MFPDEFDATAREVRSFAALQLVITAVFLVILYLALGGIDAPGPPWWVIALLVLAVIGAGLLSERVWMSTPPLSPETDPEEQQRRGVAIFAAQTVRRLAICQVPVVLSILVTFVGPWGAWPLMAGALPATLQLAWATTPSLRNTSLTEAVLDSAGGQSGLVESFRR
ncbi:hypothetical protein ACHAAC_15365 [Aeromicrobium sp. CF4.19]|uniref:hypothetical protein n=1 Tax=Aeromicrobium sp. CF4.19 TaxID=3373082 RepID=UPI003EE57BD1